MTKFKYTVRLLIAGLLCMVISSCAYFEFDRKYAVDGSYNALETKEVESFFEEYFLSQKLILKRAYKEIYPKTVRYLIFEIPRDPRQNRKDASLVVTLNADRSVILEQREWFRSSCFTPGNESIQPGDFILEQRADIESKLKDKFGPDLRIRFISNSHY